MNTKIKFVKKLVLTSLLFIQQPLPHQSSKNLNWKCNGIDTVFRIIPKKKLWLLPYTIDIEAVGQKKWCRWFKDRMATRDNKKHRFWLWKISCSFARQKTEHKIVTRIDNLSLIFQEKKQERWREKFAPIYLPHHQLRLTF